MKKVKSEDAVGQKKEASTSTGRRKKRKNVDDEEEEEEMEDCSANPKCLKPTGKEVRRFRELLRNKNWGALKMSHF